MNQRIYSLAAVVVIAAAVVTTRACGQDTLPPPPVQPGVRLGLSYPRGTVPKVVVMPVDTTSGDSVRTIIQRDLDYGDRVTPLVLDDFTLRGLMPPNGDAYNYPLFASLGAAAIVQTVRIGSGFRVTLYDVSAARRLQSRDFVVAGIPPNRDGSLVDSITVATTAREKSLRDSVQRRLRARAAIMRRPPLKKDTRARRFVVRDSLRRDSTATAYVRAGLTRWDDDRRDSVAVSITRNAGRIAREDSSARIAAEEGARMGVHTISDEIERWITGRPGIAASRIAYVHNGLIRVVDSDGANDRALTKRGLSLSPSWHPSGDRIVYSRFLEGGAGTQLEEINVVSGRTNKIGGGGLNITPVYSHDGSHVVYATNTESGTDLMMVSVTNESVTQRLTFGRGTDNGSPTFSPDGRQIAFYSTRSRFPQIYTIDTDGANLQLLTPFTPGVRSYRAAPDWSPDGRAVAYEQQNGDFQVWMINVRDKEPRQLTSAGENEGPSWAPDGRHLAISSTRGGSKQIWILDTESGRFRQLTRNSGARLSAWSPIVKPSR
ncbi:MAG: PD40 domain-containing protein [Gemmatimonadaceae bacterium]|nr:PD40 domain-containing protein [Gemmatimonadaceae bacterium]